MANKAMNIGSGYRDVRVPKRTINLTALLYPNWSKMPQTVMPNTEEQRKAMIESALEQFKSAAIRLKKHAVSNADLHQLLTKIETEMTA
jgi:hypothetical protein